MALADRAASDYAGFLLPHLRPDLRVLGVGCGSATITLSLAEAASKVIGVDLDDGFADARHYLAERGVG